MLSFYLFKQMAELSDKVIRQQLASDSIGMDIPVGDIVIRRLETERRVDVEAVDALRRKYIFYIIITKNKFLL